MIHRSVQRLLSMMIFTTAVVSSSALAEPMGGRPPTESFSACNGKNSGTACSFTAPHGTVTGTCRNMREQRLVCVPDRMPPMGVGNRRPPMGTGMSGMGAQGSGAMSRDRGGAGSMPGSRPATVAIKSSNPSAKPVQSRVPDTGQGSCFDDNGLIACPDEGQAYFGQDGQYIGAAPSYSDHGDGTVTDNVTGLMWQQSHNAERLGYYQAQRTCSELRLGGHDDWRLPHIKELFSIADFSGGVGRKPYLNPVFEIKQPGSEILRGDRFAATHRTEMMGQTWSSTIYTGDHWDRPGVEAAFFFNFLDGRIKQAPTNGGPRLFYRCARGPVRGGNNFVDQHDGTVHDHASGLTWQQADDGKARDWQQAQAYCEGLTLEGKSDWRLPNVKELQSIVDYSRHDPALDTSVFRQSDRRGWFWSSTTHGDNVRNAAYVCFGKCVSVDGVDVHGAGAQRSDPKRGNPDSFGPMGGQRDAVRINNYVRCVR